MPDDVENSAVVLAVAHVGAGRAERAEAACATLAALSPRPFVIGVGLEAARLPTIYPQPHDIAMDEMILVDPARDGAQ